MGDKLSFKLGRSQLDVPWTALDRAIQSVAPGWGNRRLQARLTHAMAAQMGGYNGASTGRRSLSGWYPTPADADSDTLRDLPILRGRSSDLARNAPVAGGAINTTVTKVVGTGLSLQAQPDAAYLGLTDAQAETWALDVERKFAAWWETTDCDITRTQTGHELTALVLRGELERGDIFALFADAPWQRGPVRLALQLVEADRCCNRDRAPDIPGQVAGVRLDDNGAPQGYWFASGNPYSRSGAPSAVKLTWTYRDAFGNATGRRNVLHVFERRRPGQTRGVPILAPVIEPLKQLERYTEAELMAAVVSGLFTVFIQSPGSGGAAIAPSALASGGSGQASAGADRWDGKLGNGLVVELGDGESITSANPGRPNAEFDPFVTAIIRQVGMLLEIPYEVLVKHYSSSYTAARGALLDAWSYFRVRRERMACRFCQPVYETWLEEAVAVGYVRAPGFFANPLVRRAWCTAEWTGDGPGAIDPLKEAQAAEKRLSLPITTREQESLSHDGRRWRPKVAQLVREEALLHDLQLSGPNAPAAEAAPPVDPNNNDAGAP